MRGLICILLLTSIHSITKAQGSRPKVIHELVYDFPKKRVVTSLEKGKLIQDTLAFDLHEHDGLRIRIRNINPFIYSVDLYELQNDQISNEKLSENTQNLSIKLDTKAIPLLTLGKGYLKENSDIKKAIDNKSVAFDKLKEIITQGLKSSKLDSTQFLKLDSIAQGLSTEALKTINKQEAENTLTTAEETRIKNLEGVLQGYLEELNDYTSKINNFIFFHDRLIASVTAPINDYSELKNTVDKLMLGILFVNDVNNISSAYWLTVNKIFTINNRISDLLVQLETLRKGNGVYSTIKIEHEIFKNNLAKLDHNSILNDIDIIYKLIRPENFELVYETQYVKENADLIEYKIVFKPTTGFTIPRAGGTFNLNMNFHIVNGVKIDVSPAIILDYGLNDPSFYFEKSIDSLGNEQVAIKKSETVSKLTPSISALLNVYKRTSRNFKYGASFGFGVSTKLRFRLYLGPTVIVGRRERAVISGGISLGMVERLQDGYKIDKVYNQSHSELPSSVPTIADKLQTGVYLAIGFNLFGQQNKTFLDKVKFN